MEQHQTQQLWEVLSDSEAKTSMIVIARLLDGDGNGVTGKSLLFSSDLGGSSDTQDPLTKFVPNMKEFGFPRTRRKRLQAYARFTPKSDEEKIETAASSGANNNCKTHSTYHRQC